MALVTTPATVLKTYEYSETSKILRLLTRDAGLCSVIAKGARRPRSRFGGLLEPFTDGVVTFYAKQGRDLHTLSAFELRRERQSLGSELVRYAGAGLLTEIVFRFAPGAADPRLFRQLGRGLDRLVTEQGALEPAVLAEAWKLIVCLGFAPNLDRCVTCGRSVDRAEGRSHFDLASGGFRCSACAPGDTGPTLRRLSAAAAAELRALVGGGTANGQLATARVQRVLLRDFITYHLAEGRPLRSFRFLEGQLG